MPAHGKKAQDVVTLDVESNLQTTEGRSFINQLNQVSHVLHLKDTVVQFKGETLIATGYVGDYKTVQLYKCPNGYFLFADMAFGKDNWSVIGRTLDEVLGQVQDKEVTKKIKEELSSVSEAA